MRLIFLMLCFYVHTNLAIAMEFQSRSTIAYYWMHPNALKRALTACKNNNIASAQCTYLHKIAVKFNTLAYELNIDPLNYGQKILALQMQIATLQKLVQKHKLSAPEQDNLANAQQQLAERLLIIGSLASPEH